MFKNPNIQNKKLNKTSPEAFIREFFLVFGWKKRGAIFVLNVFLFLGRF